MPSVAEFLHLQGRVPTRIWGLGLKLGAYSTDAAASPLVEKHPTTSGIPIHLVNNLGVF